MSVIDPFLVFIMIFGFWTSYTDIKYGRIKNITIILMMFFGIVLNIFVSKSLVGNPVGFILNATLSLVVSFGFYMLDLWSAGDAKLFLGFSVLVPFTIYKNLAISTWPSLIIMINTFIIAAGIIVLRAIPNVKVGSIMNLVKRYLLGKDMPLAALYIFGLSTPMNLIFNSIGIEISNLLRIIILIVLLKTMEKIKIIPTNHLILFLSMVNVIFFFEHIANLFFIKTFVWMVVYFQLFRVLLDYLMDFEISREVKIKDLKEGMILLDRVVQEDGFYQLRKLSFVSIFAFFSSIEGNVNSIFNQRLERKDIQKLRKLEKIGKLRFDSVKITRSFPFAPFIFAGTLVTYFFDIWGLYLLTELTSHIKLYLYLLFANAKLRLGL
ncbi:hypothetical protein A3K63_03610 [Candidatus Micrarchaeota archaeon RBG_16_49_10]|nr:MAG: hypothetical protein A3K63_03610 [Candidatus Micrarchaeota archaeon RBG_16_49_10]